MYQIDNTKTAAENLLGLINSGSTVVFTGNEYTVGVPTPFTPTEPGEVTNTQIAMTALEGTGYMGTQNPRYVRLTVGDTRPGAFSTWLVDSAKTRAALIADILENHKLVASEIIFTGLEAEMPTGGETGTLTATAVADSYLYIGTTDFTVENTDEAAGGDTGVAFLRTLLGTDIPVAGDATYYPAPSEGYWDKPDAGLYMALLGKTGMTPEGAVAAYLNTHLLQSGADPILASEVTFVTVESVPENTLGVRTNLRTDVVEFSITRGGDTGAGKIVYSRYNVEGADGSAIVNATIPASVDEANLYTYLVETNLWWPAATVNSGVTLNGTWPAAGAAAPYIVFTDPDNFVYKSFNKEVTITRDAA